MSGRGSVTVCVSVSVPVWVSVVTVLMADPAPASDACPVTGPIGMRLSSGSARGRNKCIENALRTGAQVCKLFGFEFGAEHLLARL
jgi:hypothetical protein